MSNNQPTQPQKKPQMNQPSAQSNPGASAKPSAGQDVKNETIQQREARLAAEQKKRTA